MNENVPKSRHADSAARAVATSDRMSTAPLTMVWWSLCSSMFYLVLGGTLALQFGVRNALIGAVFGVISLGILGYVFSRYAILSGNSSFLLSEHLFGSSGAALTALLFFMTASYYAVFESTVVALAASKVISALSYRVVCWIIVAYSVLLVAGGIQHFLDKFNGILLVAYMIGLALIVAFSVRHYGYSNTWLHIGPKGEVGLTGWWTCFMTFFGQQILMMCTLDMARFGRIRDIRYHSLVAFGAPFYTVAFLLNALVGIFLTGMARSSTLTETVVMDTCLAVLGGGLGLLFIWVTQTRINTANYLLAATNLQAVAARLLRVQLSTVVCAGLVGAIVLTALLFTDVIGYIVSAVNYQATMLTAWVGVALAHILKNNSGKYCHAPQSVVVEHSAFHMRGLTAWTCSAVTGLCILQFRANGAIWSTPACFVIAWIVYRVPASVRLPAAS